MDNQFNTDTKALEIRENLNQAATHNLEDWMLQFMDPFSGMSVLDIGCGRGKQVFYYNNYISTEGSIIGIDASLEAVDIVNNKAKENNFLNISARCAMIDDVPGLFGQKQFDRIISSYAIYYSSNLNKLLINLKTLLKDKGQVLICGYGKNSNEEIINLINTVAGKETTAAVDDFISDSNIKMVAAHYEGYNVYTLDNKIIFNSADDLLAWWRNHNTFVPALNDIVSEKINEYFKTNQSFLLSKNVLAIRFWI